MKQVTKPKFRPNSRIKLMDQVRKFLRYHRHAYPTEQDDCQWILRYISYFATDISQGNRFIQCRLFPALTGASIVLNICRQ